MRLSPQYRCFEFFVFFRGSFNRVIQGNFGGRVARLARTIPAPRFFSPDFSVPLAIRQNGGEILGIDAF
jgi:hypothetical protein